MNESLTEREEELLETLYMRTVEAQRFDLEGLVDLDEYPSLMGTMIELDGEQIRLTERGSREAAQVVRRHRLAERLITDVFGQADSLMHERACRFEHIIDRGLDESICTLLGHPSVCPHGKPIPRGACCESGETEIKNLVTTLAKMSAGQHGRIAYLHSDDPEILNKLMALGVVPGSLLELIQCRPSFAFRAGESQFAVDSGIAESIYVRLGPAVEKSDNANPQRRSGRRRRQRGRP